MTSPRLTSPPCRRNIATVFAYGAPHGEAPSAPSPRDAYTFAIAAERARPPMTTPGHRLYWMAGGSIGCRDISAAPDAFLVFGRHTNCDVVLERDPRLSLRHLLVRSVALDDGAVVLSVMDLQTEVRFTLPNGESHHSITAAGPVVLTVGAYALVALPSGGALPPELPAAEVRSFAELPAGAHPYRAAPVVAPAAASSAASWRVSRITLMPQLLELGVPWSPAGTMRSAAIEYELGIRSARSIVSFGLAGCELDAGVLVGRSPKCLHAGLAGVLPSGISRVHVLLLRSPRTGNVHAYDMASTQGTYTSWGHPVRTTALDGDAQLALGTDTGITLLWRRR